MLCVGGDIAQGGICINWTGVAFVITLIGVGAVIGFGVSKVI